MSKSSRRRNVNDTVIALRRMADHLAQAEAHWDDVAPGMRAQALDGDRTSGHTNVTDDEGMPIPAVADPTGEAAASPSRARAAERELDRLLAGMTRNARKALAVVEEWSIRPAAKASELADLERQADPGCELVARIPRSTGGTHWEPEYRTTDFGGLLDRPYRVGSWAYTFITRNGRLPTHAETSIHCAGATVRVRVPA